MIILRWLLKIFGTLIAFAAIASLIARPLAISFSDIAQTAGQTAFFLMVAGFIVGWKWELTAAGMILAGYTVFAAINRILFLNWILTLFPLIGIGYLILGLVSARGKTVRTKVKY